MIARARLTTCLALLLICSAISSAQPRYESYYLFLGNHPNNNSPGFHENVQGIAHDADHWFISQLHQEFGFPPPPPTAAIWRIPVAHDLDDVSPSDPGVTRKLLSDYPALIPYNHAGDIVYFEYQGHGLVILPLEGDDVSPALAVLDSGTNMAYLALAPVPQQKCGWVAVDREGNLYSSESHPTALIKYQVNWSFLFAFPPRLVIQPVETIGLHDESGAVLQLHHAQGGEFTDSGDLLYMSTGYYTDTDPVTEGIHVFDTQSWRRVQHSTNGYGHFNYAFEPGGVTAQEPEGLTLWDLDDGRAPGIRGQLHVLLLDNSGVTADEMFLKHYTHVIRVDASNSGPQDGTPAHPFQTMLAAADLAWDGAEIRVRAGTYPGPVTIANRVRLTAEGGVARIGG
jgi:hypothetical protein